MACDPADRYASAADLADDLRRFLEDRPVWRGACRRWNGCGAGGGATPPWPPWRFPWPGCCCCWRSARRSQRHGWGGSASELGRTNGALEQTNRRLEGANSALTAANGQLAEKGDQLLKDKTDLENEKTATTDKLWNSLYQQARAGRFGPLPGRRLDSLAALVEAHDIRLDDRLRTEAIACLTLTDLKPGREWPGWPAGSFDVDFDGKLERYARADRHGAVSVRRTDDDAEIAHFTTGFDAPSWVELSPDGRFAAVRPDGPSGRLQVWELGGASERRLDEPSGVVAAVFSGDSRRLAVLRADGNTDIDDPSNGQTVLQIPTGPGSRAAAFRPPDGQRLAVAGEKAVVFYETQTGRRVGEWPMKAEALAWRPDGELLAAAGRDRRIYFWDPAASRLRAATPEPLGSGLRIAFDHAGDLLAGRDASEVLRLWDPRTGRQLFATPSDTRALRFGPDDRLAGEIDGDKLRMWEVAPGGEYRTLTAEPTSHDAPEFSGGAAVGRDGRLLAAAMSDGVRLWDLDSGEQFALVPAGPTAAVAFDADGALLTHGTGTEAAVVRWLIRPEPDHAEGIRVGPPETTPLRGGGPGLACSADGRTTVVATLRGALVLRPDRAEPVALQLHEDGRDDVRDVAVSPDGRWVAACSHSSRGVCVWEVGTGSIALEVPVEGPAAAVFSPDGKWLAAGGKEACQVWTVGSWEKGRRIDGAASAFSPDGATLAVETGRGIVRLVDPQTGQLIAQLEDPNQDRSDAYFTPDGGRLVAVSLEGRCVHVWDLRRIRRGLAEMRLDWDQPDYPPAAKRAAR